MTPRAPSHVEQIEPYVPGKPIEELERELGLRNSIKLASNENPAGPSPRVIAAVRSAIPRLNRYPDGSGYYLRERIAAAHGVGMQQIVLGNGSTELVEVLARTFLGNDGWAVMADQSFIMYRIATMAVNGRARIVPLDGMTHDLNAMARATTADVRLVYIANPNNPTGTYVSDAALESFLRAVPEEVVVVLDEAYADYVDADDYPNGARHVIAGRNVAVLRTFSKIHGLAGLRVGYAVTTEAIAASMEKIRSPFNTGSLGQAAALAALDDSDHLIASRDLNRVERAFVESELRRRGWSYTPTVANFHLIDLGRPALPVYEHLLRQGIIVRPMSTYNFPSCLRVTIGTREENLRFLEALEGVRDRRGGEPKKTA